MYHGTSKKNAMKILEDGCFKGNTMSCAIQDPKFASGYGDYLVCFDYDYEIELNRHFFENLSTFLRRNCMVGVANMCFRGISVMKYDRWYFKRLYGI